MVMVIFFPSSQAQEDWKLKRDKDQITVYVREQASSPLKEYKARATIARPIEEVFECISDLERHPEWVFRCTGLKIINKTDEQRIRFHTSYDLPWPMKDRDLTAETILTKHDDGTIMESLTQHIQMDYPTAEGIIRMTDYREWVILKAIDSLNTLFVTEGFADPGGSVPPRLVNMFLVDGIYESIMNIRKVTKEQGN